MKRALSIAVLTAGVALGLGCTPPTEPMAVQLPRPHGSEAEIAVAPVTKLEDLPTAAPPGVEAAEAVIVWVTDDKLPLHLRSVWIETSSARPRARAWIGATRDEPVAVAQGALLAIRSDAFATAALVCDECAGCGGLEGSVERATSVDLRTGARHPLTSLDIDPAEIGVDARFDVVGLIGGVVFVDEHASLRACEMPHPSFTDRAVAYDLVAGAEPTLEPSAAQRAEALQAARAALAEIRTSCGEEEAFEPELYATALQLEAGLALRAVYRVTAPVPYMCGTGPGHYSVETPIVREELPARRPEYRAPSWLAHVLRETKVQGVSLPIPKEKIDAARQVFRSAPR